MIRVLHEELSRVYSCTWVGWMVSGAPKVQAKSVVSSLDRVQRIQPCFQRYNTWVAEDSRKASKSLHMEKRSVRRTVQPTRPAGKKAKSGWAAKPDDHGEKVQAGQAASTKPRKVRAKETSPRGLYVRAKETSPRRRRKRDHKKATAAEKK